MSKAQAADAARKNAAKTLDMTHQKAAVRVRGVRMDPDARESQIVEAAIIFFAEKGVGGQLRDLAKRLGVTHPLLYRYFPTKDALLERVYRTFYERHWQTSLLSDLDNAAIPLEKRLIRFYSPYVMALDEAHWLRIFTFAGLHGEQESRGYMQTVDKFVIGPVSKALRFAADRRRKRKDQPCGNTASASASRSLAWDLHAHMCSFAIRRHVLGDASVPIIDEAFVCRMVDEFLNG